MSKLSKRTVPLTKPEIEEFFGPPLDHLKYRLTMLLSLRERLEAKESIAYRDVVCEFEAALLASRMFIQFLGLRTDHIPQLRLKEYRSYFTKDGKSDEVKIVDLEGDFVTISSDLTENEAALLARAHHAASKATAHLTFNSNHGFKPEELPVVADLIVRLLKSHLYDRVNRSIRR